MSLNFSDNQKNQTKVTLRVMKPMRKEYSCPAFWNGGAGKQGGREAQVRPPGFIAQPPNCEAIKQPPSTFSPHL